mmetsp:Transcript_8162/g.16402  ORF Transcript_8162/g.16402 Transcript_8162/m.16402 type:complete len:218 (+) Transcript_8162:2324-2977(+)
MLCTSKRASRRRALLAPSRCNAISVPPFRKTCTCLKTEDTWVCPPTPPGALHKVAKSANVPDLDRSLPFFVPRIFSQALTSLVVYTLRKTITASVSVMDSSIANVKTPEAAASIVTSRSRVKHSITPTRQFSSRSLKRLTKAVATTDDLPRRTEYCVDHRSAGLCFLVSTTALRARTAARRTFQLSSSSSSSKSSSSSYSSSYSSSSSSSSSWSSSS